MLGSFSRASRSFSSNQCSRAEGADAVMQSKMKFSVKNWAEYDAGLRHRGSLTLWITAEVLDGWQAARRTTPGGQPSYSELAIETGMMLRLAFHLALRQTEGLMASIFGLLKGPRSAPNHGTGGGRERKINSF